MEMSIVGRAEIRRTADDAASVEWVATIERRVLPVNRGSLSHDKSPR